MMRIAWLLLVALALSGCTQTTPERALVEQAASALGGHDRILALKSIVIEGEGTNGNLGQDMTPEATGQAFKITEYVRVIDIAGGRARTSQTRTPNFAYFQGQQSQRQVIGIDGDVAYNVPASGAPTRASSAVAKDRARELYHHPLTIVRAALDADARLSNPRTLGNERIVDVTTANGRFTLVIDSSTKLPTRVVSMTDNVNLGDVAIETNFGDYQTVDGLKLPTHIAMKTDRHVTADLRVTRQALGPDTGDLAAPQAVRSAAVTPGPPPANVTAEEIAKGIWFLAGQSHHSVLVEFADHLTLIEAPQNDTRTLAVIAKARELRPDKPLTHVVNTHHHFDHSGGVRAAVSEGLTIITDKANAAFFQDAVARTHSINPDALARNPKALKLETVDGQMQLQDATMAVDVYHIDGSAHADTLLMAYFPRERILVEADVFSPGGAVQPYAANLLDNIKRRNLRVDRIVPIHGTVTPYAELTRVAERTVPASILSQRE